MNTTSHLLVIFAILILSESGLWAQAPDETTPDYVGAYGAHNSRDARAGNIGTAYRWPGDTDSPWSMFLNPAFPWASGVTARTDDDYIAMPYLKKRTLWEECSRVPLMIVAPRVTAPGSRCARPASLVDIYPTLVALCDLAPNAALEGRNLSPYLRDPEHRSMGPVVTTLGRGNHAVRSQRWRYIRYADGSEELYDHESDPQEWKNLADDPDHAVAKVQLIKALPAIDAPMQVSDDR